MSSGDLAAAIAEAETRLRACGLTGDAAFQALLETLTGRLEGKPGHPALTELELPVDADMIGLAYERFFPDLFKGRLGQYFTPPPVIRLLLCRLPIEAGDDVFDPTCGSGGLLVAAARQGASVRGIDIDPRLVELARLNLRLAGFQGAIEHGDFFRAEVQPATFLVANPPFSVPIRAPDLVGDRSQVLSDVLFLERLEDWVAPAGHAAVVVPWTVVANPRMGALRDRVDRAFHKLAVLQLPEGIFRPFGGAQGRAAILWLHRRPCAEEPATLWATLTDPGYDPRSKLLRATSDAEVDALVSGEGWQTIEGWTPELRTARSSVGDLAQAHSGTERFEGTTELLELSDTDPRTGEALPRHVHTHGRHQVVRAHEVLVARMRPERGNITVAPEDGHGSPEWIRLETEHPHALFHMLRTPAWRDGLPPTTGQTRPRTDAAAVLASALRPLGAQATEQVEALSSTLHQQRRELRRALEQLQHLIDAHQAGELEEAALVAELGEIRRSLEGG